jgi:hypothetical protein
MRQKHQERKPMVSLLESFLYASYSIPSILCYYFYMLCTDNINIILPNKIMQSMELQRSLAESLALFAQFLPMDKYRAARETTVSNVHP